MDSNISNQEWFKEIICKHAIKGCRGHLSEWQLNYLPLDAYVSNLARTCPKPAIPGIIPAMQKVILLFLLRVANQPYNTKFPKDYSLHQEQWTKSTYDMFAPSTPGFTAKNM